VEEVFCAEVPGVEQFILTNGLVTGNCPYFQSQVVSDHNRKKVELLDKRSKKVK
jgi:hypothetical protein